MVGDHNFIKKITITLSRTQNKLVNKLINTLS